MTFDSNQAWRDAAAVLKRGRSLYWPIAGVFFWVPAIVGSYFIGDIQQKLFAELGNEAAMARLAQLYGGRIAMIAILSFLAQAVGYLALAKLMAGRDKPTVGQALVGALRALPSFAGATLLFFMGYLVLWIALAILGQVLAASGGAMAARLLSVPLLLAAIYTALRLSAVLPVIAIERRYNPVAALARSWRLTKGQTLRLLLFFMLLGIAYVIGMFVATILLGGPVIAVLGQGPEGMLAAAAVSGLLGAAVSTILTAVLVANWRQLSGEAG
jgi:hypothetical protein